MKTKAKWVVILLLIILIVSFFVGLFGGMQGYSPIGWGLLGIAIASIISLILGGYAILHFKRTQGIKGLFIGICILLVLIPLIFAGTCALSLGGNFVRSLFVK